MTSRCDLVIENAALPDGRIKDISIRNGKVCHIGAAYPSEERIDAAGLFVVPAAVDMHVHMRGGSQSGKEDWRSGSMSALAGGVTLVVDQPNTIPPLVTREALASRIEDGIKHSLCSFAVNGGVVASGNLEPLWDAGAMAFGEIFFAPSSYGDAVDPGSLEAAFCEIRRFGALATIHAEEVSGDPGDDLATHNSVRSAAGERRAVEAVCRCNTVGARLHFCHMSTAASVDAALGSVEATPHHLFLSLESLLPDDTHGKVNPPIRSEKERQKLWLRWEQIDVIASDHAPHTAGEKAVPFALAPSGIPGVETMLPLLMAAMVKGHCSLQSIIGKTSYRPAELLGIPSAGFAPGCRADFAVYGREMTRIDPDLLHSKAGWTPFEGFDAIFPEQVIMEGIVAFRDGEYFEGAPRWYPGRGYNL